MLVHTISKETVCAVHMIWGLQNILSTVLVEDTEKILQNITAATPSIHKTGARTHVSDWISYFSHKSI